MARKGFASRPLTRCQRDITGNAFEDCEQGILLALALANKKALNIEFTVKPLFKKWSMRVARVSGLGF